MALNGDYNINVTLTAIDANPVTVTVVITITGVEDPELRVPLTFTAKNGPMTFKLFAEGSSQLQPIALSTSVDGGVTWVPYTPVTDQWDHTQNITVQ